MFSEVIQCTQLPRTVSKTEGIELESESFQAPAFFGVENDDSMKHFPRCAREIKYVENGAKCVDLVENPPLILQH